MKKKRKNRKTKSQKLAKKNREAREFMRLWKVKKAIENGFSLASVSQAIDLSERSVRRVVAKHNAEIMYTILQNEQKVKKNGI